MENAQILQTVQELRGHVAAKLHLNPDASEEQLINTGYPLRSLSCADLFRQACRMDLEGVVVKYKLGAYGEGWFKRSNPAYSQKRDRHELFSRSIRRQPASLAHSLLGP